MYDCFDDSLTGCHDHLEAKFAWHQCKSCFREVENHTDFRDGFIAGYIHVMNGGGCCRPTLPPRKYWSLCTRGADNNCRVVAWYNGWDSGVAQAQRDGMGSGPIVTAQDIYHTGNPYPVELPEDLRRASKDGETDLQGQQLQPEADGTFPLNGEAEPGTQDPIPPAEQYNPPANPTPEAVLRIQKVDGRVFTEDSLTPPAPPRIDVSVQ